MTANKDGAGLGKEDKKTLTKVMLGCVGFIVIVGYAAYELFIWLCNQTS